jgi:NADPH:quinone reductase-like Zn-dependent oxidoreductase
MCVRCRTRIRQIVEHIHVVLAGHALVRHDDVWRPGPVGRMCAVNVDALADGVIKTPLIERFSLNAAAQAHTRLESRASIGALVLIT